MSDKIIISEISQLPTLKSVKDISDKNEKTKLFNLLNSIDRTYLDAIGVDMATTICDLVSKGNKIKEISNQIGVPTVSLVGWIKEAHSEEWDEANEIRANDLIEEAVSDIEDTDSETVFVDKAKATIKLKAAQLKKPVRQEIQITSPTTAGIMFVQASRSSSVIDVTPTEE